MRMRFKFLSPARLAVLSLALAACQGSGAPPVSASGSQPNATVAATSQPAQPAQSFDDWLKGLRREALANGVSARTFDRAFANVQLSTRVVELDRSQPEFTRQPWQYLDSMVSEDRIKRGRQRWQENAALFDRISQRSGIPAEILIAHWGAESAYGQSTGGFTVVNALTSLAYDGRRSAYFRTELLAALTILERGDIALERMTGSWAGAMGQTQFMPTIFQKFAVDEDGDGRRDIWGSLPDVFASTAKFVQANGWRPGERWGEEVKLPSGFPYDQAEYAITKPMAEWRQLGVTGLDGKAPAGDGRAAILVLGGHQGPAFLVRENFRAIMKYNPSTSYALAIGLLADRLAGRPGIRSDWPRHEEPLSRTERIELQEGLTARGFNPGVADGVIGANSRTALRGFQAQVGMVPDGFPTKAVLERMRRGS